VVSSAWPSLALTAGAALLLIAGLMAATSLVSEAPAASSGGISSGPSESDGDSGSSTASRRHDHLWWKLRPAERRWANRTAMCESGRNPRAIGGGGLYRGAFQFMKSTWKASPRSPGGDPIRYSYRTQGVVAVLLKRRDGPGHWPNCGFPNRRH
jgi:hypothetical protein